MLAQESKAVTIHFWETANLIISSHPWSGCQAYLQAPDFWRLL